jgi:hypothetical protein
MTDTDVAGLEDLTIESFAPRVGERFVLENEQNRLRIEFELVECESRGQGFQREAFSLMFLGPADPVLAQQIYRLRNPELGALEIFLVPVGSGASGTRYEATFT